MRRNGMSAIIADDSPISSQAGNSQSSTKIGWRRATASLRAIIPVRDT